MSIVSPAAQVRITAFVHLQAIALKLCHEQHRGYAHAGESECPICGADLSSIDVANDYVGLETDHALRES